MIIVQRRLWDTNVRLNALESHYVGCVKLPAWHGIAEKISNGAVQCRQVSVETHLKLKTHKITSVSLLCSVQYFKTMESIWNKLWANEASLDLSLRYVSHRYPMLHKAHKTKYQPLPVASTSYHDFTKIRYPIILLNDKWKQHTKNTKILW